MYHLKPVHTLKRLLRASALTGAMAAMAATAVLFGPLAGRAMAQVPCTGICAEAENFVLPTGSSTMGSGPNASGIVNFDVRDPSIRSGGKNIWNYTSYDWLEWEVDIPSDGLYTITYRYASGWTDNEKYSVAFTFWTSGQQFVTAGAPANSPTYQDPGMFTFPIQIPLKAGKNRFRAQVRPDLGVVGTGGSYNLDYIKFDRVGDYPNLVALTGTVKVNVNGTPTPVESALVSEDPDPAKGAQYTEASHIARTDASGKYTLYLSSGAHTVTAFLNGYNKATASATAPGTHDFALTYNGTFEAELLDATNPGASDQSGVLPAYSTVTKDVNGNPTGTPSGNGYVANTGRSQGKFASYRHIYVPQSGVYDLSMHYASQLAVGSTSANYQWTANSGAGVIMPYTDTADFGVFQDSGTVLLALNAGQNTVRWTDPDAANFANMDTFTLTPTTHPHGTLSIVVKDSAGKAVPGAKVTISGDAASYFGNTDGNGTLSLPVAPTSGGPYTITVSKAGATASDTATVADAATVTKTFTLAISAILVEAEDVVASGPDVPGPAVDVVSLQGASGGKVIEGLSGAVDPGQSASNYRWAEWIVNAPSDGLYDFSMQYATLAGNGEFTLHVDTTSYTLHYLTTPPTGGPTDYAEFTATGFEAVPLKAGPNRFRITAGSGGLNVDYFTFNKSGDLPAMGTITGKVLGSDGTGSAPIRGAFLYTAGDPGFTSYSATTNATGAYTLHFPVGTADIQVLAPGYKTSPTTNVPVTAGGTATKDITLQANNPDNTSPPALRIGFPDVYTTQAAVYAVGPGSLATTVQEIAYVSPGPDTWIELNVNVPRSGMYTVGINYGSAWPPADQPGHLTLSANGQSVTKPFDKTADWPIHVTVPDFAILPLLAGPNVVRITFPDAAANISYLNFTRTGDIVLPPSTDINNSGATDILDAVLYARRLSGLDTGPTPDLTGDAKSDAADVRRILAVAGGLQ